MKIAFLSEGGFDGKLLRSHPNGRVDVAWQIALDSYHFPMYGPWDHLLEEDFDLGIWIIPKKNIDHVMKVDYLRLFKQKCKKVAIMQEGPSWFFQDYPLDQQVWFYNTLCEADIIFAHNYNDLRYFEGLTNHKNVKVMQSVMIEDAIDQSRIVQPENRQNVIIGGNMCRWYGGFDSMVVAQELDLPIFAPAMGRKVQGEEQLINILPYVQWNEWIVQLSKFKYAVHLMPTQAAGTFALNCGYLGIPNIGYEGLDTQETLFPYLTVEMGDISTAKQLLKRLQTDQQFYEDQSHLAKVLYRKNYTEEKFKDSFYGKLNFTQQK